MIATAPDNYVYLSSSAATYNIRLKPSTKYILSAYIKSASGTPYIRLAIKQDDGVFQNPTHKRCSTSWVRYEFIVTTGAGLTDSGLILTVNEDSPFTTWFDAIQVEEASAAASPEASPYTPCGTVEIHGGQIEAETITAGKILTGTITANEIAATTITAAEITANTITASQIHATTITASEIATDAIET